MIDHEPPVSADDTQPRAPIIVPLEREPDPDAIVIPDEPRGCSNPLLIVFVTLCLLLLFVATVGLACVAGYRDGVNDAAIYAARTKVAVLGTQRAYIITDQQSANWEAALVRCQYVGTLQPADPAISKCINDAQRALSATATATITPTLALPTVTPTTLASTAPPSASTPGPSTASTGFDPQEWYARAQEELRNGNLEQARDLLEAVRGADPTFNQKEVETALCSTYETLGSQYDRERRLSEMVIVINKALKMNCRLSPNANWEFTINAAQLYLDAKGYLDAGNYAQADSVFRKLMRLTTIYQNTKELACQAFAKAGDTDALKTYSCPT